MRYLRPSVRVRRSSYTGNRGGDPGLSSLLDAGLAGFVLPGETTMKRVTLQQAVEPAEQAQRVASAEASHGAVREISARGNPRQLRGAV